MHAAVPPPPSPVFLPWGPSHLAVLAITVLGAVALVVIGRRAGVRTVRVTGLVLAGVLVLMTAGYQISAFDPAHPWLTLPLQLSDLAPYAAAYAVVSGRPWAYALTYYWGLTLSVQALLTPALGGGDFPAPSFLVFFTDHVLVVWIAVLLTWGMRRRPTWHDYRFALAATVVWAAPTQVVNALSGANYGYLDHKPETASLLNLLGPWPWYLLVEAVLVVGIWALITLPWQRSTGTRPAGSGRSWWPRPRSSSRSAVSPTAPAPPPPESPPRSRRGPSA
ncbi:TIGR02206 family membrane protein [Actinomycetospora endophytica]|uniref:TIGR02206 family membrane protein n=1 Tax=Actinomycetospora endophytica TaxID=2291215 RepID=A0ABS8P9S1_9PSEU|nr:TIGR02206 family membrane protein [Actinomycetospora endophytica]MCD2194999.1 TIGR02206 family membrane protein [Actinomycetospora endophytica]